jgi:hypothetical protein
MALRSAAALVGLAGMLIVGAGAAAPTNGVARVPALKRIVVVVFENKRYEEVIDQPSAPTFNALARRYALLTRYFAVAHPSLPNYLALVSGSTQIEGPCGECVFDARNLADTIEASGRTWKTYADGLPGRGFTGDASGGYVRRHNPLLHFASVRSRPDRLRRIVPFDQLALDLARGRLPDLSIVVPDLCNSMHDCSVAHGDAWLGRLLKPLLASRQVAGGGVFVTFDEGAGTQMGGGRVAMVVAGPGVRPGSRSQRTYTHYSLLRTIEDAWRLPYLGRSAQAAPITGIWR